MASNHFPITLHLVPLQLFLLALTQIIAQRLFILKAASSGAKVFPFDQLRLLRLAAVDFVGVDGLDHGHQDVAEGVVVFEVVGFVDSFEEVDESLLVVGTVG